MDEESLRTDYWVDTRNHPDFPYWVIFKHIGHDSQRADGAPYLRATGEAVPEVLKRLELHPGLPTWAHELSIPPDALRAAFWYAIWLLERMPVPSSWHDWNHTLDEAWQKGVFNP